MSFGRLAVRVVIGGLFIGHGTQKLAGWFGGSGLEGTDKMMAAVDMYPVRRNAIAVGVTETAGGALLIAGGATPLAAAGLIGSMTTAVRKVHGKNGPWNSNRGWELNAIIVAALTLLVEAGPGRPSVDAALGRVKSGPGWALAALGAGVAGSAALVELGRRAAQRAREQAASASAASTGTASDAAAESDAAAASDASEGAASGA
ncbi:hypothetical protein GCM10022240_11310 [Microbacterium kribbense]|uniref:DoxX family protein n=1 Tax=Microbacterium kribbense TaxID=433645 RepID=A0ABP7GCK0_9MICO